MDPHMWPDQNRTGRTGWGGGDGAGPDWMGAVDWARLDWMGGGPDQSDIRQTKGSRIKDHGPCFGTNEHPRRDTDVILRQSKAPIEIFNSR